MKEIYLYSGLYSFVAERLISEMNQDSDADVVMRINSPGGEVFAGWGVVAKMRERKGKVYVKVDGFAASMAAFIPMFADNVEALDVSTFLLHRAAMYIENPKDQEFLDKVNKDLRARMESKLDSEKLKELTGVSIKDLFEKEERIDLTLTAKQAKQIGLVDTVKKLNSDEAKAFDNKFFSLAATAEPAPIIKNENMTLEKLKAEHPELYAQIVASAVAAERDRAEAWMVFVDADPKAVAEGIKSGNPLSAKATAELTLKLTSKASLTALAAEAVPPVNTPEIPAAASANAAEVAKVEAEVKQFLNIKP
jgi:ATP-dependent protease ClpP protease subunit